MNAFVTGLRNVGAGASAMVEGAVNETVLRVAVTGLSRAGKTVFMTSLIHNLLALGAGRNTLPGLQARLSGAAGLRLRSVRLEPAGSATLPAFEHGAKLRELAADVPAWPPRTDDLAQIALTLEVERSSAFLAKLGTRRIRLELLDYPGEWLLDLPLLDMTHAAWSRQTQELLGRTPRAEAFAPFLTFQSGVDPNAPADDELIRKGHTLYRAGLQACRMRFGLRYLQPGRFLCPGPRSEAPFLWFFPLAGAPEHPLRGSLAALLRDRFETYKADMRAQFFDTHFAAFDRQIVLVDVLGALHAGRAAYEDTESAIADIAAHLRYRTDAASRPLHDIGARAAARLGGSIAGSSAAGGLLVAGAAVVGAAAIGIGVATARSRHRIERVAFVATKADHVPSLRRENLRNLVRAMAERTRPQNTRDLPVSYHAAASVLSTEDATAQIEGRPVEVVRGVPLGETRARSFYPGDVPSGRPPDGFWKDRYFELPVFAPPRLDPSGKAGIPHLALDNILVSLLGDKL